MFIFIFDVFFISINKSNIFTNYITIIINATFNETLDSIIKIINIRTVKGEKIGDAPYGVELKKALNEVLEKAKSLGFRLSPSAIFITCLIVTFFLLFLFSNSLKKLCDKLHLFASSFCVIFCLFLVVLIKIKFPFKIYLINPQFLSIFVSLSVLVGNIAPSDIFPVIIML